jgi:hypothetical protein
MIKENDGSDGDPDDVIMSDKPFDQNQSKAITHYPLKTNTNH